MTAQGTDQGQCIAKYVPAIHRNVIRFSKSRWNRGFFTSYRKLYCAKRQYYVCENI